MMTQKEIAEHISENDNCSAYSCAGMCGINEGTMCPLYSEEFDCNNCARYQAAADAYLASNGVSVLDPKALSAIQILDDEHSSEVLHTKAKLMFQYFKARAIIMSKNPEEWAKNFEVDV